MSCFSPIADKLACKGSAPAEPVGANAVKDLRHAIPKTFEDGMNSSDPAYLREVLTRLVADKCVLESYRLDSKMGEGSEVLESSLDGKESIVQYFCGFIISTPDSIFLIHEWKLFPRAGNQSCMVFKFSFTGSQVFEYEQSCMASDHTKGYQRSTTDSSTGSNSVSDGSEGSDAGNEEGSSSSSKKRATATVTFKESGRNTKYESRKRKKIYTIGEYVDSSRIGEDFVPLSGEDSSVEVVSGEESSTATRCKLTKKVNICGVMRFHLNAALHIWKVHCVHIHDH